ncbi:hypothetical protein QYF36_020069 [Acer negundo]|nr:hypothetical protein QYF36_020069 [Acer negundo]
MEDMWTVFCGESGCSDMDGKRCKSGFMLLSLPNSCINHVLIVCFNVLLLVMLVINMIQKSKTLRIPARFQRKTPLQIVAAAVNGCLGLVYLGLGIWILEEKLRITQTALPLSWWLLVLVQGVTWLIVSLTLSLRGNHLPRAPMRLLSIIAFLYAVIVCALSIFAAILNKGVSIKIALDVLSLPGAILLLSCAYKYKQEESDVKISEGGLYEPLNGEANGISTIDSVGEVSRFANAGFFSKMSFWWLNSLLKRGREKTLEDEDIPDLREEDRAESCYLVFLDHLNKQKQKEPSSQPSILRTIILCHWTEIFVSGLFALLKVLTVSAGPLLLNAFILVAEGNASFKYEGYVLAIALFTAKSLESLSQRQWYFRSRLVGLKDPVRSIPDVIGVVIQAKVAFARIVKFLEAPELQSANARKKGNIENIDHAILIKSADFSWEKYSSKPTLRNINLEVRPGERVAICGEVGSGKSTLLASILGEVPNTSGNIQVHGRTAYVSQTAWIQTGSIRENILFGSPMDSHRYQETIESAVDAHTATSLFNEYVMGALSGKAVLLVTHQVDFLPAFDAVLLMSDGEILREAPYHQLLVSSIEFRDLVNAHKETAGSERLAEVTSPQSRGTPVKEIKKGYVDKQIETSKGDQLIKQEEREIGDTGLKPYIQYLNQNKGFLFFSMAALSQLIFVIGQVLQNSWMASNVDNPDVSTLRLIVVYLLIGVASTLFLLFRSLSCVLLNLQSSKSLFSQLLNSLFRAPMSFYDSTPLGRILSRISSDLSIVDLDVPFSLVFAVGSTTNCYTSLVVLAVVVWQVLFVSIPMIYTAIRLQGYYFSSAKELMRINGTTKSLVANHLAESIAGAMTIRAFEEEDRFFTKNLDLIDTNASPFFHNFAANEWLIGRLEILSAAVVASAALCMVLLPSGTFTSGFVGMALSYAPEVIEDNRPPPNWPVVGKVDICDLQIRYRLDAPLVLRGNMGGSWEVSASRGCRRERPRPGFPSCGRWIELEHGTKTTFLFGSCSFEEKPDSVAHRIPTVMDCTKVLAISDGKLVEYDEPMKLMKKEGIWILEEKLRKTHTALPLNQWLLVSVQGVTWLFKSLFLCLKGNHLPRALMRLLSILAFLLAVIICSLSIFAASLMKKVSMKIALDVVSFPGSILLLICAYKHEVSDVKIVEGSDLHEPLNVDANGISNIDSVGQVTRFAKAGFLL